MEASAKCPAMPAYDPENPVNRLRITDENEIMIASDRYFWADKDNQMH